MIRATAIAAVVSSALFAGAAAAEDGAIGGRVFPEPPYAPPA